MDFSDWLTQKYVEWRGNSVGHERTIREFAEDYVGVSQQLMSEWMTKGGKIPRSKDTINKLVDKFGYEVYEVLGFSSPQYIHDTHAAYNALPAEQQPEFQEDLERFLAEWLTEHGFKRVK